MVKTITDLESRAFYALQHSPIHALRDLQVEQQGDDLIISGRVASFYHKQLAQEALRMVADGRHVVNEVAVD